MNAYFNIRTRSATWSDVNKIFILLSQFADTYKSLQELQEKWQSLHLAKQTLVAVADEGKIIGYAELLQRRSDCFRPQVWVAADYQRQGLGLYLLQLLEAHLPLLTAGGVISLSAQIVGESHVADKLLAKAGYSLTSTFEIRELIMNEVPPTPASIAGIEICPLRLPQDLLSAYHADEEAFLDEYGYVSRSFEQWRRRIGVDNTDFDPTCCFVAWDNGVVAGGIYTSALAVIGEIAHLGVRRSWRQRGLGESLSLHALRAYYERGIHIMCLNVDAKSLTHAQHLYARLGFLVKDQYRNYTRVLTFPAAI